MGQSMYYQALARLQDLDTLNRIRLGNASKINIKDYLLNVSLCNLIICYGDSAKALHRVHQFNTKFTNKMAPEQVDLIFGCAYNHYTKCKASGTAILWASKTCIETFKITKEEMNNLNYMMDEELRETGRKIAKVVLSHDATGMTKAQYKRYILNKEVQELKAQGLSVRQVVAQLGSTKNKVHQQWNIVVADAYEENKELVAAMIELINQGIPRPIMARKLNVDYQEIGKLWKLALAKRGNIRPRINAISSFDCLDMESIYSDDSEQYDESELLKEVYTDYNCAIEDKHHIEVVEELGATYAPVNTIEVLPVVGELLTMDEIEELLAIEELLLIEEDKHHIEVVEEVKEKVKEEVKEEVLKEEVMHHIEVVEEVKEEIKEEEPQTFTLASIMAGLKQTKERFAPQVEQPKKVEEHKHQVDMVENEQGFVRSRTKLAMPTR